MMDHDVEEARESRLDREIPEQQPAENDGMFIARAVVSTGTSNVGKVFKAQPTAISGSESEGSNPTILTTGTVTVPVVNLGPIHLYNGNFCQCRRINHRWVTTNYSTRGFTSLPRCPCTDIPTTLAMTSSKPTSNNRIFQNATFNYVHPPSALIPLHLDGTSDGSGYCFLSTAQFRDYSTNDQFWYSFGCYQGFYIITRVYATSTYSSPYRDQIRYRWLAGTRGNTCSPFSLTLGTTFAGGDTSCIVTISG